MNEKLAHLIDTSIGKVSREIFWDKDIYRLELQKIFSKCWIFVAHESQISEPGNFIVTNIGEDSVIVSRDKDKNINVFLNSCPHRGNRLCFADKGKTRSFVCNYHGWSFDLSGDLRGMPEQNRYEEIPGFEKAQLNIHKAAKVNTYKGMVFATFDENSVSLDSYLGDFRWYLDILLDNDEGGTEFIGGTLKSIIQCNWKFPSENFVGDSYHAPWTHISGARAVLDDTVKLRHEDSYHASINGHGWEFSLDRIGNAISMYEPIVIEYMKQREAEVTERLGKLRSRMWGSVSSGNVFPNLSFLPGYSMFKTWTPLGPHETEVKTWCLVNKNAPDEVKQAYRRGVMKTFSTSGVYEMDDGENWEHSTTINAGYITRNQPLHYSLGITSEITHDELPGQVFQGQVNDANQRLFYEKWLDYMSC